MKVAALQFALSFEDRETNYKKVARFASKAKASNADVLVLPEMFSTGFSLNPSRTAEGDNGPTISFLKTLATDLRMNIVAGIAFRAPDQKAVNCAVVIDSLGAEVARYTKMKLFSHAGEHEHHLPGKAPVVFSLDGVNCACFICYDLRFPSLFRMVSHACEAIFVIASWPSSRQHHWDILLPARAIENQLYIVGVNHIGHGGGLSYTGGSKIIDPLGEEVSNAKDNETLIFGNVDAAEVHKVREELPFLEDRDIPIPS